MRYTLERDRRMWAIPLFEHAIFRLSGTSKWPSTRIRRWDARDPKEKSERTENKMKKVFATMALGVFAIAGATAVYAKQEKTTMVGGMAMYPSKDIVDNAVNSADHTTLVAAVKAAGLVETLKGAGPFTVFA